VGGAAEAVVGPAAATVGAAAAVVVDAAAAVVGPAAAAVVGPAAEVVGAAAVLVAAETGVGGESGARAHATAAANNSALRPVESRVVDITMGTSGNLEAQCSPQAVRRNSCSTVRSVTR
jgi:hypothetical protein